MLIAGLSFSAGQASAETAAYGAPYTHVGPDCMNSVVVGRDSGQIYAYAVIKCGAGKSILNPDVGLSGDNGKYGIIGKVGACGFAAYCESPRVYLSEVPGVTYRATNAGTIDGNIMPPNESVIARAQIVGGGHNSHAGTEAGSGRVKWADFNGDGKADYITVEANGAVKVWLNNGGDTGGGWQSLGQVATGITTDASRVRFADFDGDGLADYICVNTDGSVRVYLNHGGDGHGGWQDIGIVATGLTTDASRVRFADIDGDGRADYNMIDGNGAVHTYLNRGGDTGGGWSDYGQIATGLTSDVSRVRLADFDGDGKADYIAINPNGSVVAYLNRGGDGHGSWQSYGQVATGTTTNQNAVVLSDFTGDGRCDYLTTNPNGSVNAYRNDGGDGHGAWTNLGQIALGA